MLEPVVPAIKAIVEAAEAVRDEPTSENLVWLYGAVDRYRALIRATEPT